MCRFLPPSTAILGYARSKLSDQNVRDKVKPFLKADPSAVEDFLKLITYLAGSYDDPKDFKRLDDELKRREREAKGGVGRLFYLALPPSVYPQVSGPGSYTVSTDKIENRQIPNSPYKMAAIVDFCTFEETKWPKRLRTHATKAESLSKVDCTSCHHRHSFWIYNLVFALLQTVCAVNV